MHYSKDTHPWAAGVGWLMYNLPEKKPTRFLNPSISIEKYKKLRVEQLRSYSWYFTE